MDSKIKLKEKVANKDRRFGSALSYFPVMVEDDNENGVPALFTSNQIKEATERAARNPEDIPGKKSFWERLFG